MILIGQVAARISARGRFGSESKCSLATDHIDPTATGNFRTGSARWWGAKVLKTNERGSVEGQVRKLIGGKPAVPVSADRSPDNVAGIA